jgi:hypothetical protein
LKSTKYTLNNGKYVILFSKKFEIFSVFNLIFYILIIASLISKINVSKIVFKVLSVAWLDIDMGH